MPELEQTGIEALFEVAQFVRGLDTYLKGLKTADAATQKASSEVGRHGDTYTTASSKMGIFSKALHGIGGTLMDVAKTAAGFVIGNIVTGAIQKVTAAIPDMISAASNLSETQNKVNVIFGDSASAIQAYADTAATSIGQSTTEALNAAATFGIFGKAAGLTGDELADFSTGFTTLASDLASFNNTSPEEATLAIGAALRGEAEPLRRYGVLLNDATMRQKAFELGLISSTKEALTPANKILAAQALIYEQTADAQGDFARTSDGLANQQRILKAQFETVKTTLGTALLPVVTQVANFVTKFLSSPAMKTGLDAIVKGFSNFAGILSKVFSIMTSGGDPLKNLELAIYSIFGPEALAKVQAFIQPLQENLPAVLAALSNLWTNVLQPAIAGVWDFVQTTVIPIIAQLWTWLWENLPGAINTLVSFWTGTLQPALAAVWDFVQTTVFPIIQTLFDWLATNLPPVIQALADFWTNTLLPAIQAIWEFLTVTMMPVWEALAELLEVVIGNAITVLVGLWENVLQPALLAMWDFIQTKIIPIFEGWVESLGGVEGIIKSIVDWIKKLTDKLKNMKLPAWLTPGSPTPFELGLVGINDALNELATKQLPKLTTSLDVTGGRGGRTGTTPVAAPVMARRSISTTNNQTANVNFGGVTVNGGMGMAELEAAVRRVLKSELTGA